MITQKHIVKPFELPYCFSNFCRESNTCQSCDVKADCRTIKAPKEPLWCNNP